MPFSTVTPEHHPMKAEASADGARVRFTCTRCPHCVQVDTATGQIDVIDDGDRHAVHSGSNFDRLGGGIEVDLGSDTTRRQRLH